MHTDKYSRQILAFGSECQKKLSAIKVGIVGVGGIGSQISQNLAYLGIHSFIIVDDDTVEESNLNRLVGATKDDAVKKRFKVDVAERMIEKINPDTNIEIYHLNLRNEQVLDSLTKLDFLFGCVDNDSARLILTELSAAYEIPLIDSAFEIQTENNKVADFGGRVIVAIPGEFCISCANQLDHKIAQIELESSIESEFREKHGYGLGAAVTAPAVISLNTIIAGMAVTEFLVFISGIRQPNRKITYKGMRGVVFASSDEKKDDCIVCNTIFQKRDSADLKRYARLGLPEDLPN